MLQTTFSPMSTVDPFADMRRMQSAVNRLFDGTRTSGRSALYELSVSASNNETRRLDAQGLELEARRR